VAKLIKQGKQTSIPSAMMGTM